MQEAWRAAGVDPGRRRWPPRSPAAACSPRARPSTARARARRPARTPPSRCTTWSRSRSSATWAARVPPALAPLLERYREIYEAYEPADARYLANHRGHLMFLRPEEQEVCTADLIRTMTFTGTRPALRERLRELREAGYNHFAISIRHGHPGDAGGLGGRLRGRLGGPGDEDRQRVSRRPARRPSGLGHGRGPDRGRHPPSRPPAPMVDEYAAWYDRHLDPAWQDVLLTPPDERRRAPAVGLRPAADRGRPARDGAVLRRDDLPDRRQHDPHARLRQPHRARPPRRGPPAQGLARAGRERRGLSRR